MSKIGQKNKNLLSHVSLPVTHGDCGFLNELLSLLGYKRCLDFAEGAIVGWGRKYKPSLWIYRFPDVPEEDRPALLATCPEKDESKLPTVFVCILVADKGAIVHVREILAEQVKTREVSSPACVEESYGGAENVLSLALERNTLCTGERFALTLAYCSTATDLDSEMFSGMVLPCSSSNVALHRKTTPPLFGGQVSVEELGAAPATSAAGGVGTGSSEYTCLRLGAFRLWLEDRGGGFKRQLTSGDASKYMASEGTKQGLEEHPMGSHFSLEADVFGGVEAWHQAMLDGGAACNGPPGLRPDYSMWMLDYYGGFAADLDGWHAEACAVDFHLGLKPLRNALASLLARLGWT